ncbi:MAG TPA: hypothetical protein VND91_11705 [Candidatus Saccharimonadia bacterium]|nr:hypothetical protein [Candidatus Saccharimonadia bacterium]
MSDAGPAPISEVDRAFFARHAPRALARRDDAWFLRQRLVWADWLVTGVVGLLGLYVFGWSATTAALVLVAGFWLGWLGDVVFAIARGRALAQAIGEAHDDEYVWALVEVMRGRRRDTAGVRSGPGMGLSIVVDFVAGAVATALLLRGFASAGIDVVEVVRSKAFVSGTAILLATGVLPLLASRLTARGDSLEPPMFRVGQRGIGLLVLVFALMAAGGGALAATTLMAGAFGFLLVMGAIQTLVDVPHRRAAAEWLRRELH